MEHVKETTLSVTLVTVAAKVRAMWPLPARFRQTWRYGMLLAAWAGANLLALAWIEHYESWKLEEEFDVPASVIRSYQPGTTEIRLNRGKDRIFLRYRFGPPPRWAGRRTVPLVVFLHGAGDRGSDNVRQLSFLPALFYEERMRTRYPCAVLAPQCPEHRSWSSLLDADTDLLEGVSKMIDDVSADHRIDPDRIYLAGLSMGGSGSWELAMRQPHRFAAVVPVCGGGDESRAARLVGLQLWAVHGAADEVVPVSASRRMIAAMVRAGGNPRYSELPDVGHNCWDMAFSGDSEVLAWMFQRTRNTPAASMRDL